METIEDINNKVFCAKCSKEITNEMVKDEGYYNLGSGQLCSNCGHLMMSQFKFDAEKINPKTWNCCKKNIDIDKKCPICSQRYDE